MCQSRQHTQWHTGPQHLRCTGYGHPGASGARASVCPLRVAWARAVHGAGTSPPQQLLLLMMTPFTQESQLTGCLILKSRSAWLPASMTAVVAALRGGARQRSASSCRGPLSKLEKDTRLICPSSQGARPAVVPTSSPSQVDATHTHTHPPTTCARRAATGRQLLDRPSLCSSSPGQHGARPGACVRCRRGGGVRSCRGARLHTSHHGGVPQGR